MQNRIGILIFCLITLLVSCKKTADNVVIPPPTNGGGTVPNSDTTLKTASPIPFGIAIDYNLYKNNATYRNIVNREASVVVFGYQMKHGAIVKDDGSFDYTQADDLFNLTTNAGLEVYGHTLVWHQNQNGNYLRSLTIGMNDSSATNLLTGGDFQDGTGTSGSGTSLFTGWNLLVGGAAAASFAAVNGNNSSRALEVTVNTPGANAYDVQAIGPSWAAKVGSQYKVLVDIKSSVNGGKVRLVNQNTQYQQLDVTPGTSWATYSWTLTAQETSPMIRLNFPVAGVYTIDNIRIIDPSTGTPLSNTQIATAVDTAMSKFIRTTVMRYAGKIKAWDVVNEPMSDGTGTLRTSGTMTTDAFYWAQYLGRDYALKAFKYAKAADPNALLFINDYNLEYDSRKLDSLIAYVNELKSKGAVIDGIGTQMHMNVNTSQAAIDNMFQKLAATGLKIRISELDIRVNPSNTAGFTLSASVLNNQASMYKYVVDSYFKNMPAGQRYGIIVWGVGDSDSWIVTSQGKTDYPLLFDGGYNKKPAYSSLLQALKSYK